MPEQQSSPENGDINPESLPRCETCEHYRPATNQMTDEAMMACLNGQAPTKGMAVPDNFSCILHSSFQAND